MGTHKINSATQALTHYFSFFFSKHSTMNFNFNYRFAVCRRISKSLPEQAIRDFAHENDSPVDFELANEQWDSYVSALKSVKNLEVIILDAEDDMPDCVFTEDAMVAVPSLENPGTTIVLVTNPGAESRRNEVKKVLQCLEKLNEEKNAKIEIHSMQEIDSLATLEGGDVQFTGTELFVGNSERTNARGIDVMKKVFKNYDIHAIQVAGQLHLKSCLSLIAPGVIAHGSTDDAKVMITEIKSKMVGKYEFVEVEEDHASNAVFLRDGDGGLVCLHAPKVQYPASKCYGVLVDVLDGLGVRRIEVNSEELGKVDGCLSCCSVLIA